MKKNSIQILTKYRAYLVIVAFALPLFFFAANGFGSEDGGPLPVWKPVSAGNYVMPPERSEGWQVRLRLLSRT
ncbi:MAG TPA: hypothetical protein VEF76_10180 [Patescibacteria group bacterium]|nr:hypothetical protein [Patescibacteria group bacterium]